MIVTLESNSTTAVVARVEAIAARYPGVTPKVYRFEGAEHRFVEVHLIGSTATVPTSAFEDEPGVRSVVRVSTKYRLIGRHAATETHGFEYNGVRFDDSSVQVLAGLCAVDTREHVAETMAALKKQNLKATRMGVYKPRTSPYEFQGLGAACLPWVFELADEYGIKVIAMEITDARHIDEIRTALVRTKSQTGVLLQIGTRNAQNFELLKLVGQQRDFPVLFKRGMGITLEESLNACEYIASEGNPNIVFCLRGVKTHLGDPLRNLVDFAHVPVVRKQTRLVVCIDPSHSVGRMTIAPDGISYIHHAIGQGLISGATVVLVDMHPKPEAALCDGPQALVLQQLPGLLRYVATVRGAYVDTTRLAAEAAL